MLVAARAILRILAKLYACTKVARDCLSRYVVPHTLAPAKIDACVHFYL